MKPRYQAGPAAIDLIKRFEGFRAKAEALSDGRWTVGYGHIKSARAGAVVTEADADALLIYDVAAVVAVINASVFSPLTQNQFDALVAFAFNIGPENFRRSSVARRLNEGAYLQAACAMEMWRTADFENERIVVDALVRRRSAEMALFLTPADGYVPVPSPLVRPRVDETVAHAAPAASIEIQSPLDYAIADAQGEERSEPASAALAAAEAVTARLNAMLRDVDESAPPVDVGSESPPLILPEPRPFASAETPESHADAPSLTGPDQEVGPIAFRAFPQGSVGRRRKKPRAPAPVLVLMGLTGLGVAGAGPFWGFSANTPGHSPLVPDPQMAGLGLGVFGVGLLAASVYLLLTRLTGHGD